MPSPINAPLPGIRLKKSYARSFEPLTDLPTGGTPIKKDDATIKMMVTAEEKSKTYTLFFINGSQALATDHQGIRWSEGFVNKSGDFIFDLGEKI